MRRTDRPVQVHPSQDVKEQYRNNTYIDQEGIDLFIPPLNQLIAVFLDDVCCLVPGLFLFFFGEVIPALPVPVCLMQDLYYDFSKQDNQCLPWA